MEKDKVLVEVSARHVHITQADLEVLFGAGQTLTPKKPLSQPNQYAAEERVDLVGPKSTIKNVVILGPVRKATQVEVSLTDARTLGVDAIIRESGHIGQTKGIILVGPKGQIELSEGVIAAKRHVHLTPETALYHGVEDKQIVNVKIMTEQRSLTFGDVVIRVSDTFAPAMHIDTDEANAAGISGSALGEIIA
jgi:putative phosphotransacetylase